MTGLLLQGYAFYALLSRSLVWPLIWPSGVALYLTVWLLYMTGYVTTNVILTSEFVRKTQLESDLTAAQRIQRTLQPDRIEQVPGYQVESYYKPIRGVGGDYFDVIDLEGDRRLFALADVSGKGMPAALLASNIQALVRSMADEGLALPALADRINRHLSRHTPSERFATAIFAVLDAASGELTYVNAGHNPAMLCGSSSTRLLGATGVPLGLFPSTTYEAQTATMDPGDLLVMFTDGLPDSIPGDRPEDRLRGAVTPEPRSSLVNLTRLIDAELNEDDVTILIVKRLDRELTGQAAPPRPVSESMRRL